MLTLLEGILQLIRPDRLPILARVPSRPRSVLQVLLGLEIASSPTGTNQLVGPQGLKSTELLLLPSVG